MNTDLLIRAAIALEAASTRWCDGWHPDSWKDCDRESCAADRLLVTELLARAGVDQPARLRELVQAMVRQHPGQSVPFQCKAVRDFYDEDHKPLLSVLAPLIKAERSAQGIDVTV